MATAHIISTSAADGRLIRQIVQAGHTWAECLAMAPATADLTGTSTVYGRAKATAWSLCRAYVCFNLAPYAGATISAATLNLTYEAWSYCPYATVYYNDWGTSLAAADWGDLSAPASASYNHARMGGTRHLVAVTLTNLSGVLAQNGRFEIASTDEATEPTDALAISYIQLFENTTEAERPSLDITYTAAASGCPKMTDHYASLRR